MAATFTAIRLSRLNGSGETARKKLGDATKYCITVSTRYKMRGPAASTTPSRQALILWGTLRVMLIDPPPG